MPVDVPVVRPAKTTKSTHISEAMGWISVARDGLHELIAEEDDDSNPVRAKMGSRPRSWICSSCRAKAGKIPGVEWLTTRYDSNARAIMALTAMNRRKPRVRHTAPAANDNPPNACRYGCSNTHIAGIPTITKPNAVLI